MNQIIRIISFHKSCNKERKFDTRPKNKSDKRDEFALCSVFYTGNDFYINHGVFRHSGYRHCHCKYRFVTFICYESYYMTHK